MSKFFRFSIYTVVLSALVLFGTLASSSTSNAQFQRPRPPRPAPQPAVERGAGIGIGTMCAGAITALARQPELEDTINENYEEALAILQTVPTRISAGEFSEAVGILGAALVENLSRQPETEAELRSLADMCIEDLMSLL